jgi:hypothetical protein
VLSFLSPFSVAESFRLPAGVVQMQRYTLPKPAPDYLVPAMVLKA